MLMNVFKFALLGAAIVAFFGAPVAAQRLPVVSQGAGPVVPLGTINVVGRGVVRVPADLLLGRVMLFSRGSSASLDQATQTIVAAMRAHGIPDAAAVVPMNGSIGTQGNSNTAITGSLAKPTRERAEAILRDVLKALPDSLATVVTNAQVQTSLWLTDCAQSEGRAQQAALDDARRRAQMVAHAAGVRLGPVVGVTELQSPVAQCGLPSDSNGLSYSSNDLAGPLAVSIFVNANVSFAIR
jgi:uncharacterized protein YggE